MSYGTGDFSKVTFESFEINKILFIAFRVKLHLKKISSELICDIDKLKLKFSAQAVYYCMVDMHFQEMYLVHGWKTYNIQSFADWNICANHSPGWE